MFTNFKSNLYKNLLKVLGVSSFAFILEACYGVPSDVYNDTSKIDFWGKVSTQNDNGIKGIQVDLKSDSGFVMQALSDETGYFSFQNVPKNYSSYEFGFKDIDSTQNGYFDDKDTTVVLSDFDKEKFDIPVTVVLKEK